MHRRGAVRPQTGRKFNAECHFCDWCGARRVQTGRNPCVEDEFCDWCGAKRVQTGPRQCIDNYVCRPVRKHTGTNGFETNKIVHAALFAHFGSRRRNGERNNCWPFSYGHKRARKRAQAANFPSQPSGGPDWASKRLVTHPPAPHVHAAAAAAAAAA